MSATSPPVVLDASAVLALLQEEERADAVEGMLDGALMSCVYLSVVLQKEEQHGADVEGLEFDLEGLGVEFRAFDTPAARATVCLAHRLGLSLGDRACLALARTLDSVALTADRRWQDAGPGTTVRVIR